MDRLANRTLSSLPPPVGRPRYDRAGVAPGIVHLGLGAFHRGHEAVFTDAAVAAGDARWGILGASLRSPETRDALAPQDWLYTVASRDGDDEALQVIGVLQGILVAPESPQALLAAMADGRCRIVSLTVTEKGYGLDPATGSLDARQADIRHDLESPQAPRSALGFVLEALARRRTAGLAPFTVLCCDNLSDNGRTVARLAAEMAALRDPDFGRYVQENVAFPATMLDRIVPATTAADREHVAARLGLLDAAPVIAEAHNRWVVEDRFPAGRPDWASVGVELVDDIAPYEAIKLKLLNASHSALAYLGYLAGHETIPDATHDPVFRAFIEEMMDEEIMPTLRIPASVDAVGYRHGLIRRFANRAVRHRTWQIAMDGSQKLPPRLLGTIREGLAAGLPFDRLALAVAGWMRYVTGRDEHGGAIDLRDPLADRLKTIAAAAGGNPHALADGLLELREVFGTDLPADATFRRAVTQALERVFERGARTAVAETLARPR